MNNEIKIENNVIFLPSSIAQSVVKYTSFAFDKECVK